jgi:cyclopropane-fatty-acyl-phospholipid synthase
MVRALDFETPFRVILPGGDEVRNGDGPPAFVATVKTDRALRDVLTRSTLGFGEAYTRGDIEVEGDLRQVVLLSFAFRERMMRGSALEQARYAMELLGRRNTRSGSRRNIKAHYDLANDFYELWLDKEMQYTCAYFATPGDTLEVAQLRKMDLVCRKLDLRPGELVVEAGGGWGGLALHMARHWGVKVKSFNISANQVEFARERARRLGVGTDQLEYVHDDYRNIPDHVGECDKFASICMLEHVGRENYDAFHRLIEKILRKPGLAMLQFISRMRPSPIANPWLEKYVFPGYYNPSLGELLAALEKRRSPLHVIDAENMRYHYALTLQHWLDRFEANAETIRAKWGEGVVRAFRLYLTGGLADFGHGAGTLVYQLLLSHGCDNSRPLTRRHMMELDSAPQSAAAPVPSFQPA